MRSSNGFFLCVKKHNYFIHNVVYIVNRKKKEKMLEILIYPMCITHFRINIKRRNENKKKTRISFSWVIKNVYKFGEVRTKRSWSMIETVLKKERVSIIWNTRRKKRRWHDLLQRTQNLLGGNSWGVLVCYINIQRIERPKRKWRMKRKRMGIDNKRYDRIGLKWREMQNNVRGVFFFFVDQVAIWCRDASPFQRS